MEEPSVLQDFWYQDPSNGQMLSLIFLQAYHATILKRNDRLAFYLAMMTSPTDPISVAVRCKIKKSIGLFAVDLRDFRSIVSVIDFEQ
jgi:hypothetical protein